MDLDLSDDQAVLREEIRSLLARRFTPGRLRSGFDRWMWEELWRTGAMSLRPDGFGWSDRVVVFEQLGAGCVPGPLVPSVVVQGMLDGIAVAVERPEPEAPVLVAHLDTADAVVVFDRAGAWIVASEVLDGEPQTAPLDPLTPVWLVDALPRGERVAGPAAAASWRAEGATLTAAFLVGMADRLTAMAVDHARDREQFGRPIGAFQAVKHILADMAVRTEVARAAAYAAGAHLDEPEVGGAPRSVAGAKLLAGEAAILNGRAATQVLGATGFTWDADVHLYLKRAWVLETQFGSSAHHADVVARLAGCS